MNKTMWYKRSWGLVLTIIFLPFFAIWYIWAKTEWSKRNKWIGTTVIAILMLFAIGSSGNQPTVSDSKQTVKTPTSSSDKKITPIKNETKPAKNTAITSVADNAKKALYNVVKVVDGDTIDVNIDGKTERLRLIGIDTPETVDPRKPVQCFGQESTNKAKELLSGKKVSLESDPTQGEKDKYDRLLRYVFLENGTDFQKLMIGEGYGHEYTYNLPYKYMDQYKQAEKAAREANKGLWAANTCDGDTTKAAVSTAPATSIATAPSSSSNSDSSSGVVKKSKTGICHAPGTTYYNKTTNYTPFDTVQACLNSGGRLPLR